MRSSKLSQIGYKRILLPHTCPQQAGLVFFSTVAMAMLCKKVVIWNNNLYFSLQSQKFKSPLFNKETLYKWMGDFSDDLFLTAYFGIFLLAMLFKT